MAANLQRLNSIIDTIGRTPVIKIKKINPFSHVNMFVKCEAFNPGGSVKDRLAMGIIEWAEKHKQIKPGQTVIEASSGNTGIGLAMVCAEKGYPFVCVMAESFSVERRKLMRFLGAKVVLTPAHLKGTGMVEKAKELAQAHGWFLTRQFENDANAWIHETTTGPEIIECFRDTKLDYLVMGYGTGGTLKGVGKCLKETMPDTKIILAEPDNAPLIYSGIPQSYKEDGTFKEPHPMWRPHVIQGWTTDFIPKLANDALLAGYVHQTMPIGGFAAMKCSQDLAAKEGILTGISGGGCFATALEAAKTAPEGSNMLVLLPDTGERYLSTPLFDSISVEMTPEETEISKSTPLYRFDVQQAPPAAPPVPDTDESRKFVEDAVSNNKIVVFSLEYCEFCWSATKLLNACSIPYEIINVDALKYAQGNFGGQVRTSVCTRTGAKTFPQIIINGKFIGGCTDLFDKWKAGEVQAMLAELQIQYNKEGAPANPYEFLPKWLAKRG